MKSTIDLKDAAVLQIILLAYIHLSSMTIGLSCICGEMKKMPGLKIDHIIVGVAKQPMGPVLVNNHFAGTQPHLLVFSRAAFMLHQNWVVATDSMTHNALYTACTL